MNDNNKKHQEIICKVENLVEENNKLIKDHLWRNNFHYSAKSGWINDPCGLIQFKGKYHLFAQHHPFSGKWGQMHWSHAISDDLVNWDHLPEALAPSEYYDDYEGGGIFTGSAIEDDDQIKLFYTACAKNAQTQCMACSKDGITFDKYDNNPIISSPPKGMNPRDFRDPKVFKHDNLWYMVTGTTAGESVLEEASTYEKNGFGKVALYRSSNLVDWEFFSYPLESLGELGTMLECPNFFELDGKFVMMYSPMGMQQRQVVYLTGDFDFNTGSFYWDTMGEVDWGFDYYAPQFFTDNCGRTIIFAWAGSWPFMPWCNGEFDTSEFGYYGSITLPRIVKICKDGKLSFTPAKEVEKLRNKTYLNENILISEERKFSVDVEDTNNCEIEASFDLDKSSADSIIFEMKSDGTKKTLAIFNIASGKLIFDRTQSGSISALSRTCPLETVKGILNVQIFIDSSTIEIFTDEGRTVLTNNVYSPELCNNFLIYANNGEALIKSIYSYDLKKSKY
jgi:beta-fructofuranosidase